MAAIAAPLVRIVATRALARRGAGAAAGVAGAAALEEARRCQEEAERVQSSPIAQTEATTKEREPCPDCPPDNGKPVEHSTAGWPQESIDYQVRISGLPVRPGFITEWLFNNISFDGFDSGECLLKEAKSKYDQFFDKYGRRRDFWEGHTDILAQARRQSSVATPQPPVRLCWYFMQPVSYQFFSGLFASNNLPIETVYHP